MASTNQSPFYQKAEEEFHEATTDEERIACLEIMMKEVPKHKSSENMRKNLTNRYKKLKSNVVKQKGAGKGGRAGIKKAYAMCLGWISKFWKIFYFQNPNETRNQNISASVYNVQTAIRNI